MYNAEEEEEETYARKGEGFIIPMGERERDAVRGAASLISHRFPSHVLSQVLLHAHRHAPLLPSNDRSGVLVAVKGALFRAYYAYDSETET